MRNPFARDWIVTNVAGNFLVTPDGTYTEYIGGAKRFTKWGSGRYAKWHTDRGLSLRSRHCHTPGPERSEASLLNDGARWEGKEIYYDPLCIPTWQTEPPTEAGWYPAIMTSIKKGNPPVRVLVEVVGGRDRIGNSGLIAKSPLYDLDDFSHWWPIPTTMPEPPEGV